MNPTDQSNSPDPSQGSSCARYKYQRLRDRLRDAVRSGELSGKLPGERELARRYEANAKTINKALSDLASEGMLVRHVGRGTFVADGKGPASAPRRKLHTYVWVCSSDPARSNQALTFHSVENLIRESGQRMLTVTAAADGDGEIPLAAISPGQLRSWDGIVLGSKTSDGILADLHRRHLPCVMLQNTHERIRCSTVLPDYASGAFELTEFLIRLGHVAIELVLSAELIPAACAAEAGYRAALLRHDLQPSPSQEAGPDFDLRAFLSSTSATATVCIGAGVAERVHRAAQTLNRDAKLSVVAMPEPGASGTSSLTAYEARPEDMARWVVELLTGSTPGQPPRCVIVPGKLIDRSSAFKGPGSNQPLANPQHASL
jgi:DNA-binding LacI/PurR family transcriptional regulator